MGAVVTGRCVRGGGLAGPAGAALPRVAARWRVAVMVAVGATTALLAHLDLPTAPAAPLLWAAALLAARRGGALVVAAVCGVVVAPVVGALLPRGLSVACLGALAVGLWPLAVFGAVRLGPGPLGAGLAAAAHLLLDALGDATGLPLRPPAATAEAVPAWPALWPLVRAAGTSVVDVLLVGASALGWVAAAKLWARATPVFGPGKVATATSLVVAVGASLTGEVGPDPNERDEVAERAALRVGVVAPRGRPGEARLAAVSLAARRRERRAVLARSEALAAAGADLVVWPENGFGGGLVPSVESVAGAALGDVTVLVAGDLYREGQSVAALAAVADGETLALREKTRGIPGVEAPARARDLVAVEVAGRRVVPLLCYESIWRPEVRQATSLGDLLVVQSDATSFAHTSVPRLHWRLSAMLALEQGAPLLFVAREGGVGVLEPAAGRVRRWRAAPGEPVTVALGRAGDATRDGGRRRAQVG